MTKSPQSFVEKLVEQIECEAAQQSKTARNAYAAEMKVLRSEFSAKQRDVATRERNEIKRIERWRVNAVATVQGLPVPFDDMRSVRRQEAVTDARGVSLPKLRCVS